VIKVDAICLGKSLPKHLAQQLEQEANDEGAPEHSVQTVATLIFELLGNRDAIQSAGDETEFNPLSTLSEPGNSVLRQAISEPSRFTSAVELLRNLDATELKARTPASPNVGQTVDTPSRKRPGRIQRRIGFLSGTVAGVAILLGMVATAFIAKFDQHSQPKQLTNSVNESGAHKVIQDEAPPLPSPPQLGAFVLKSDPAGLPVEIVGKNQEKRSGVTPMNIENMAAGDYSVTIKRTGWPTFEREVNLQPNTSITVEHTFAEVKVTLESDPSGATIFKGDAPLGTTPLTISLPPDPVTLVSHNGTLAPVTKDVIPDSADTVEFKHAYGTLTVTSDSKDAQVIVGGLVLGNPPIEKVFPPGLYQVVLRTKGAPEQEQTAEIQDGATVALRFTDPTPASTVSPAASPAPSEPAAVPDSIPPSKNDNDERRSDRKWVKHQTTTQSTVKQLPRFESWDEYNRARREAFQQFDALWDQKKKDLKVRKDWLDYQATHSSGRAQTRWQRQDQQVKRQDETYNNDRRTARDSMKLLWNEWQPAIH
jgi:hypothetical protein